MSGELKNTKGLINSRKVIEIIYFCNVLASYCFVVKKRLFWEMKYTSIAGCVVSAEGSSTTKPVFVHV